MTRYTITKLEFREDRGRLEVLVDAKCPGRECGGTMVFQPLPLGYIEPSGFKPFEDPLGRFAEFGSRKRGLRGVCRKCGVGLGMTKETIDEVMVKALEYVAKT